MPALFNNRLRQIILLLVIVFLAVSLLTQLYTFLPGLLGAITLFILTRTWYQKLIEQKKWKKGFTAILFILGALIVIAIPIYFSIRMVMPKISALLNNQQEVMQGLQILKDRAIRLLSQMPAEKNAVIKGWESCGWKAEDAGQTQAMLHLKKHYCDARRCLHCAIGLKLMNDGSFDRPSRGA